MRCSSSLFGRWRRVVSGWTEGVDLFDDPLSDGSVVGSDDSPGHQVHRSSWTQTDNRHFKPCRLSAERLNHQLLSERLYPPRPAGLLRPQRRSASWQPSPKHASRSHNTLRHSRTPPDTCWWLRFLHRARWWHAYTVKTTHLLYNVGGITAGLTVLPVYGDAEDVPQAREDLVDNFGVSVGSKLCGDDRLLDVFKRKQILVSYWLRASWHIVCLLEIKVWSLRYWTCFKGTLCAFSCWMKLDLSIWLIDYV